MIRIDDRLRSHIPPLRPDEYQQLEENILRDGCKSPLILWGDVLLDGHNRYQICQKWHIPFSTETVLLEDFEAAEAWIEENQLGRRNLTPDQFSYYVGKKYERLKKTHGGTGANQYVYDEQSPQIEDSAKSRKTAHIIACQHGIGKATVERAAEFARAIDVIANVAGDAARTVLLSGESKATRADIIAAAKQVTESEDLRFDSPKDAEDWLNDHHNKRVSDNIRKLAFEGSSSRPAVEDDIRHLPSRPSAEEPMFICQSCGEAHHDEVWHCPVCARHWTMDEDSCGNCGIGMRPGAILYEESEPTVEEPPAVHNHRAQGTGENEWYTPSTHIDAARYVLGEIDLDPASSEIANEIVQATKFFSLEDDGLAQTWHGRVWMNPPYAQPWIARFTEKLVAEYMAGNVSEAIALTHNYTDTAWFHHAAGVCDAICFTRGRIGFLNPEGERAAPTQGQAFFYFGDNIERFAEAFSRTGFIVYPTRK